jgi:hypothetical protein
MTSCDCGRTYRNITAWPVHCPCGYKLYADDYDAVNPFYGRGKYGFVVPCFMEIGGTESWHLSLLPRLRDVSGLVVLNPSMASGPLDRLGCEVGVGIDAARKLAKASRAIVVWNIGDALGQIASRGCRVVSVSHTDSHSDWTSNLLQAQAPWTDHVVTICKDSRRLVPEGIPHSPIPNAPDPLRVAVANKIEKPQLGTIVQHDAEPWEWAEAIRAAERKPIDDLDRVDDWVSQWQSLLDSLRPLGERKAEICRSNACGHYDAGQDACGLIAEKGRPGKVSYILNHPATRCVDSEPRF